MYHVYDVSYTVRTSLRDKSQRRKVEQWEVAKEYGIGYRFNSKQKAEDCCAALNTDDWDKAAKIFENDAQ